jgi:pSer/pThr/pTyr-binding forkhead associated (FHA) protein
VESSLGQLNIYRKGRLEGVFYLPGKPVVIGRSEGVDIQLLDARVSRRHAVIRESVAGFMIQDMSTKNGTFVNKESIDKSLLFHGDSVIIGAYTLQFQDQATEELPSEFVQKVPSESPIPPLKVPRALADRKTTSPRANTQNSRQGPPATRVSRLDRKAPAMDTGHTSIPIIEGLDGNEDESLPSYGSLDLSNIEIEIT